MIEKIKLLLPVCCIYMCEALNLYLLYPFSSFLLVHYGIIDDVSHAGYYSGLFTSVFSLSQFLSCVFWGKLSDNFGRKNVIIFGLFSSSLCSLFFGFCQNIYLALFFRFLTGLFNGNAGIIKTYVGEISNAENKAQNYAYLSLAWSIGAILGPLFGGYLYNYYPLYPALFPCMIIFLIYMFVIVITDKLLIENKKKENNTSIYDYLKNFNYLQVLCNINIFNDTNNFYTIMMYVAMTVVDISISEILPLFLISKYENGGLQYNSTNIGNLLMITSLISIFLQPLFNIIEFKTKRITFYQYSLLLSSLFVFITPFISLFHNNINDNIILIILIIINIIRYTLGIWSFSLVYMFISSFTTNENKGEINGLAQSLGSFCKIIFPVLSSNIFTITSNTKKPIKYISDYHFIFNMLTLWCIIPYLLSELITKENIEKNDNIENDNIENIEIEKDEKIEI